jgi:hypothetical protein
MRRTCLVPGISAMVSVGALVPTSGWAQLSRVSVGATVGTISEYYFRDPVHRDQSRVVAARPRLVRRGRAALELAGSFEQYT